MKFKRRLGGTGGGPFIDNFVTPFEKQVLDTINVTSMHGHIESVESSTAFSNKSIPHVSNSNSGDENFLIDEECDMSFVTEEDSTQITAKPSTVVRDQNNSVAAENASIAAPKQKLKMSRWWKEFEMKKHLTDEELLDLVNISIESEDEVEFEDSGDEGIAKSLRDEHSNF
ncbi:unnamed protein product [Psylliodes chrysocephalus]|uniref:Uncharacterized protein n=1 Tax=Psylliodes chrysocephalus TaxID=3402493 RepID=A0A9P0CVM7_9CUCU|nr:unnamed protein product [Psylliodes chrysocephala]